ncbi:hypothetical protein NLI94_08970 [Acidithiobacillus ferrivorans]|nr:hypothetical protein [Acidithiobacillus ferrivorans]
MVGALLRHVLFQQSPHIARVRNTLAWALRFKVSNSGAGRRMVSAANFGSTSKDIGWKRDKSYCDKSTESTLSLISRSMNTRKT